MFTCDCYSERFQDHIYVRANSFRVFVFANTAAPLCRGAETSARRSAILRVFDFMRRCKNRQTDDVKVPRERFEIRPLRVIPQLALAVR